MPQSRQDIADMPIAVQACAEGGSTVRRTVSGDLKAVRAGILIPEL